MYQQLNKDAHDFRIVTLLAARTEEPIQCSLETCSLEAPGVYEALSYTWGKATQRCGITVNTREQSITTSLECALRQLRLQDSHR
ncbi:hypothetical protein B0H63DRAFT_456800 [Podospora didyma]|uniref:Heterokaryon incompatibility domain-containing protein n=1 Tax=Podospora didyma TaxID=330526 RepID=A0AAE0P3R8_9PEZI|nr:hypothetical protein B0H63DRAFT_456800 [Podospora didyma]